MNRQITKQDLEELERLLFTSEEVGGRECFEKVFGHQQNLGMFIRRLVGLDREAINEAFGELLHNEGLDGVFGDDGATRIVHLLQEIEMRAAA